jgi:outer membrane protein TolC
MLDFAALFKEASRVAAGTSDELLRLGLSAEYEVDLWGRIRSEADAARLRAQAGREAYHTAAVSLFADVIRQDQLLESTREQAHIAKSAIGVFNHQLAVLLGRSFEKNAGCQSSSLPGLPSLPETDVPSQLLSRRPDVREARRRLQAADKDLAAAQISRYPRLGITATASTTDQDPSELFSDWLRSVAANLVIPIVIGGRLRAEADAAEAVKYQRLYEYGQIVVEAFQEVEDALVQEEKQKDRVRSLRRQLDLAQQARRRLTDRYFNGAGNYIDVLSALTDEQQLRRDLLGARQQLLEYRVALYRALAGGFETRQEEN